MKLTYVIQIYISMLLIKNDINTTSILYTGSYKIFRFYGGIFQSVFYNIYIALIIMKLTYVIQIYKSMLPLKMVLKVQIFCMQAQKRILTYLYCINYNEINVWHSYIHKHGLIKNYINATNNLYTSSYKSFLTLWGKCLKRILIYLYCINYNEINICISDIQKHASYKKWYKYYKYFVYRLIQNFPILWGKIFKMHFNIHILH